MLNPYRLKPIYKEKVWGGRHLETLFRRQLPPSQLIGESWEIADHPHGESVVSHGPEQGAALHELLQRHGASLLGSRVYRQSGMQFPLLVKYIDASDVLSVQVHPDDAYAREHENEPGKTEMWYVLSCEPGAELIAGLRQGVTREIFVDALRAGNPGELLHHIPVKAGDTLFIPAGRIHAITAGLVILEIQQNSDTTYRLYDWGRERELHIEQALDVVNWKDYEPMPGIISTVLCGMNRKTILADCRYFTVEKYDLLDRWLLYTDGGSFHILNCAAGHGVMSWELGKEKLDMGDTLLIPASIKEFTLDPSGSASFVMSYIKQDFRLI